MCNIAVAPLVGAWIEIALIYLNKWQFTSLLSWERGLKSRTTAQGYSTLVAPLVGAWIEMDISSFKVARVKVAPLVGAWIEISV